MAKKMKTLQELKDDMDALRQQIELREREESERAGRALLQSAGCSTLEELRAQYKLVKLGGETENE